MEEQYIQRKKNIQSGFWASYDVFSDGVSAKDDISQIPCRKRRLKSNLGTKGRNTKDATTGGPLQSGRTTDMTLAPQLVSLTEKSPFLSSYAPTIFLVASAGPVASAKAASHSSARNSSRLAIGVGTWRPAMASINTGSRSAHWGGVAVQLQACACGCRALPPRVMDTDRQI